MCYFLSKKMHTLELSIHLPKIFWEIRKNNGQKICLLEKKEIS